jgi:hypothetical protein
MSSQGLAGHNIGLDGDGELRDGEDTQDLVAALEELLERLSGRNPDGAGTGSETIERWDSDEFLYVETPLSRAAGAEIDVNIQGGRAFIRMAR